MNARSRSAARELRSRFSRRSGLLLAIAMAVAGLLGVTTIVPGDDGASGTPYDGVWQQVSQLLEVREYSSALEVIREAATDSDLRRFKDRLDADRRDVNELQRFATLVKDQAAKLKTGDTLKVGSSEYKVVRFVSDAKGDRLVLESGSSSSKTEKSLIQLDPRSWIALAEPKLTASGTDRYLLGIFQASVEHGDRKAAREALNLAAMDKISVTHWTARIEAEAKAAEEDRAAKKAELDDRILGTWRLVIGEGKGERRVNITFRPRGKTDARTTTWRKSGPDTYVFTAPHGGTARVTLGPKGEGLRGKTANGSPVKGFRQAKSKR